MAHLPFFSMEKEEVSMDPSADKIVADGHFFLLERKKCGWTPSPLSCILGVHPSPTGDPGTLAAELTEYEIDSVRLPRGDLDRVVEDRRPNNTLPWRGAAD